MPNKNQSKYNQQINYIKKCKQKLKSKHDVSSIYLGPLKMFNLRKSEIIIKLLNIQTI